MSPNPRKPKKAKRKSATSSSKKASFRCIHCNLSFHTRQSLIHHAHRNTAILANDDDNQCLKALKQCPYCQEYWPNEHSLNLHLNRNLFCKRRKDLDDTVNEINYTKFESIDLHHQSTSTAQILSSTTNIEPSVTLNVTQHASSTSKNPRYSSKSSNEKRPSFDTQIMTSNHLFDVCLRSQKNQQNDIKVEFYTDLLSRSVLFKNNDESCKLNFKSLYIEISNLVSQIQIEHETTTLPGYETKYLFSNICHSDIYHFLSSINPQSIQSQLSQSSEESLSQDHVEDIFSDQDEDIHSNDDGELPTVIDTSIIDMSNQINEARKHSIYSITDEAMLELHHILKGTNAPLYLFDELTSWCQSFSGAFGRKGDRIDSRETFLKHLGDKVNSPVVTDSMKPIIEEHVLPSGGEITITRFDLKSNIASLLSNDELMKEENLLIDLDEPFSVPQEGCILDDLNSGWWHRETHQEICTGDNELLLPIVLFIDGGKITERLSVEPIVFTLGIFNRATRNLPSAWRTLGYIENVYNSSDTDASTKNAQAKARDYHFIMERLLVDVKSIQGIDGGFNWLLRCRPSLKDVIFKIAIQSVLGDCEGLDKLCAMLGGHNLQMKLLCRDCKVSPLISDDPDHICQFITKDDVHNKSDEELALLSIRPIRNAFRDIYFGARSLTIHECTPPEPLHQTRLGLVKYLFEMFLSIVPPKTFQMMNQYVRYIYRNHSRQSNRDFPDISPFENGLTNPGTISAEFQYSRLYAIFLCFLSPPIYKSIATLCKSQKVQDPNDPSRLQFERLPPLGYTRTKHWFELIQGTLSYYQFLMSPQHEDSSINVTREGNNTLDTEPLAQHCIRQYMHKYKFLVGNRKGHGLCINKFHQSLHYTRQMSKDGSLQNIDTGRPESNAVSMYKRLSLQTQLRRHTVIRQVALRHYEDLLATEGQRLAKIKIHNSAQADPSERIASHQCSKFELFVNAIDSPDEEIDHEFQVLTSISLRWITENAKGTFSPDILTSIAKRLFLNTSDGGCITEESRPIGFTEHLHMNSILFRAHPNYRNEGKEWFDWCNLKWDGLEEAIPSKIIMFLDLSKCMLRTPEEINSLRIELGHRDAENMDEIDIYHNYLTPDKWVVVRSALTNEESDTYIESELQHYNREVNFSPRLARRIVLEDKCRIVPIDAIESGCYAVPMFQKKRNDEKETYIICNDVRSWMDEFVTQYNTRV